MPPADRPPVIRDSAEARRLLAQGLWWQRVRPPKADSVREALVWAKEVASGGKPLPPLGFLADLGHAALAEDWEGRTPRDQEVSPHLPVNLVRTYEDHVLGKLYADWTFGRACDALRRYAKGREQGRGLAYLVEAFRERGRFGGVEMSVGAINALLEVQPEELLSEGYESLRQDGPHPLLPELYESLIQAARRTPEVLGPEDLFDLESRAALEEFGQRLAHRQVLRAAAGMAALLPKHKVKPLARRMEVPTRILDEDMYPVGGFTSLSNRGSIESLLHSQLAYMEPKGSEGPDLFDTMFLMDELLYYARDENQFLRRRRTFVIALSADLAQTRFKDAELPYQRVVMLLGLLYVLVKKLVEWLSTDALSFQFYFPGAGDADPLAAERAILAKLFYEEIPLGVVHLNGPGPGKLEKRCEDWSRKSMVHVLSVGVRPAVVEAKEVVVNRLAVASARPELGDGAWPTEPAEADDAGDAWGKALQGLLARWV